MIFLKFDLFKPETWLSEAADGIMGTILSGLRTMLFYITSVIYGLMVDVYNLFEKLCSARILGNDVIELMAQRIGIILGLIMFFYVIFSFIQMLISPEKLEDKEKGAAQIVKKAIMVVVMLGVSTFFFEAAYGIQTKILDSNIIGKLLIPYEIQGLEDNKFGNLLSVNLLKAFYHINPDIVNGNVVLKDSDSYDDCNGYLNLFYNEVYKYNRYDLGNVCLNANIEVKRVDSNGGELDDEVYVIDFNGFIAPIVGGFTVYLMLMYCFKVGVRMIQLAFLEIISPMAIVSYLSPKKDTMFTKWWKIYFSTYIDVFIRIAIINLIIFLICTIYSTDTAGGNLLFWESLENAGVVDSEKWFFSVVIVLALLTFAKKAPDLIKELLPASASKLGFGASMKDIVGLKETIGMTAGATTASAIGLVGGIAGGRGLSRFTGALGGLAGGIFRGGKAGFSAKGIGKSISSARDVQAKANMARAERIFNGGSLRAGISNTLLSGVGVMSGDKMLEEQIATQDALEAALEKDATVKAIDVAMSNLTIGGKDKDGNEIKNKAQLEAAYNAYKDEKKLAMAKVLREKMDDKTSNIYLYSKRLSKQDSVSSGQIKNIYDSVKNGKPPADIINAYKEFGGRNDERKNTRERNRIQKGK